jgi:hypothetical protein
VVIFDDSLQSLVKNGGFSWQILSSANASIGALMIHILGAIFEPINQFV